MTTTKDITNSEERFFTQVEKVKIHEERIKEITIKGQLAEDFLTFMKEK